MMITTCLILWMPRGAASALGAASAASASMPAAAARHRPPRSNHHPAPLSSQLTDQTYTTRDRLSNTVSRFCYPRPMSPQAQRTRRREQRESTRRQILGAAERLLRERPFRELSVDAVMADTGLTRSVHRAHGRGARADGARGQPRRPRRADTGARDDADEPGLPAGGIRPRAAGRSGDRPGDARGRVAQARDTAARVTLITRGG